MFPMIDLMPESLSPEVHSSIDLTTVYAYPTSSPSTVDALRRTKDHLDIFGGAITHVAFLAPSKYADLVNELGANASFAITTHNNTGITWTGVKVHAMFVFPDSSLPDASKDVGYILDLCSWKKHYSSAGDLTFSCINPRRSIKVLFNYGSSKSSGVPAPASAELDTEFKIGGFKTYLPEATPKCECGAQAVGSDRHSHWCCLFK